MSAVSGRKAGVSPADSRCAGEADQQTTATAGAGTGVACASAAAAKGQVLKTQQQPANSSKDSRAQKQQARAAKRQPLLCCFAPAVVAGHDSHDGVSSPSVITIQAAASKSDGTDGTWAHVLAPKGASSEASSSSPDAFEEFFDARSQASSFDLGGSGGTPHYQAEVQLSDFVTPDSVSQDQTRKQQPSKQVALGAAAAAVADGVAGARQVQQKQLKQEKAPAAVQQEQPHWVPNPPLMFSEGLEFVPVPAVTGFAGKWDLIPERTSPHPQPIDVMIGANAIIRRIHASLPGIVIEEDAGLLKVIGQPGFIPKGIPSVHTEPYDKTHATKISWWPRRDVALGKAVGEVFFTADGGLILRSHTYPLLSKQPDFVVEDYLSLEDGGNVVVDRMCCFCTRTGRRAEQLQVVRRSAAAPTSPRWA